MKSSIAVLSLVAAQASAEFVNGVYYDAWHTSNLPGANVTAGINHVYLSFTDPTVLATDPVGNYTPFVSVDSMREQFGSDSKIIISVGGWTWTPPFANASANATGRELFAKNVATMLDDTGADGVDIDWEYPCGNGIDYKQVPNSEKTGEAETFPALLEAIRSAIGTDKELSIAVPGKLTDMMCYTNATVPRIAAAVDYFNIMTYDLMNRRDNITKHHSDVTGSETAVDAYLSMGLPASKAVLGFAFYAKWFTTDSTSDCATQPLGCATVLMEDAEGNDLGTSGALTFEPQNMAPTTPPTNLTDSPDGSCGANTNYQCADGNCCSSSGYCGSTDAYCSTGCQEGYGNCTGVSITDSWARAQAGAISDTERGGEYFWDSEVNIFWTWDTPTFIAEKFTKIVSAKGLGGVMAWSLGEDTYDNSHLLAIQKGVQDLTSTNATSKAKRNPPRMTRRKNWNV